LLLQECPKFIVGVLSRGQCVVSDWRGDGLDAGQRAGDDVVLPGYVPDIGHEL
jgi:hypothetical protein